MEAELDHNPMTRHKGLYIIGDGSGITHSFSLTYKQKMINNVFDGGVYVYDRKRENVSRRTV